MPIPPPSERPDLYDDFDFIERPPEWVYPVKKQKHIQRLIDVKEHNGRERVDTCFKSELEVQSRSAKDST